jgi:hypothetical protein
MTTAPRAVLVHRPTEFEELLAAHGTRAQVAFFLASRGRSLEDVDREHAAQESTMLAVSAAVPVDWRRGDASRDDLDRYPFRPDDVVIVVGQDGLVANVAKYLDGQPVIGVDPTPWRNPGILVPIGPDDVAPLLLDIAGGHVSARDLTMVEAVTDDGQVLRALNEVFVGHPSHQSARYTIRLADGRSERQSSSGMLVATETGSTGWCLSVALERGSELSHAATDGRLVWFVREAWPSPATGTELTEGILDANEGIEIVSATDRLVVFGDGIERDAIALRWGQSVTVRRSARCLRLAGPSRRAP